MTFARSLRRMIGIGAVVAGVVAAVPGRAQAFCGFFVAGSNAKLTNNASQVVLMRKGNRTVMTMSNNYQGPPENFAMVVPVPVVLQKENVKTLPADVFDRVDSLSAPRLVEYWEQDPCRPQVEYLAKAGARRKSAMAPSARSEEQDKDLGVTIEAKFVAGEYQILILSATDSSGLETWLRREKYSIPAGRRRGAGALHPRQVEVLRRQGRHPEGEARRARRGAAVAAAVLVRRERAARCPCASASSTRGASRI